MNDPAVAAGRINALLGRRARGLRGVAVADASGAPVVVRVAPLVEGKPFPTLFWLVDPHFTYAIDRVEAAGLIARLQARINGSGSLCRSMSGDHRAHIRLRDHCTSAAEWSRIESRGFAGVFARRGIGGIEDWRRVRCLHTWYAAHLVIPNSVGAMLEAHWAECGETALLRRRGGVVVDPGAAGLAGCLVV